MAEDTAKTETANAQPTSDVQNKTSTEKDQMACKSDTATADLDKLIADMNGASSDKKVDAIAAVVTKLAQELKAQQPSGTNATSSEKSGMDMCQMMMGMTMKPSGDNQEGDHEHHH